MAGSSEAPNAESPMPFGMKAYRRYVVTFVVLGYAIASAYEVKNDRDDWPLSTYNMYSGIQGRHYGQRALVGVSDKGEFQLDGAATMPLTDATTKYVLQGFGRNRAKMREGLELMKENYDSRRARGLHHGPDLIGMRLYSERWDLKPDASNVGSPHRRKEFSVTFPEAKK